MTILDRLAEHAKERVEQAKEKIPLEEIRCRSLSLPAGNFDFETAVQLHVGHHGRLALLTVRVQRLVRMVGIHRARSRLFAPRRRDDGESSLQNGICLARGRRGGRSFLAADHGWEIHPDRGGRLRDPLYGGGRRQQHP